jgi:hypothetical protein
LTFALRNTLYILSTSKLSRCLFTFAMN